MYLSRSILSEIGTIATYDDESLCNYTKPRASSEEDELSLKVSSLVLSPNPVNNILNLNIGNENVKSYRIYTVSGSLIQSDNINNNQVSVQNLRKGFYLINAITTEGKEYTSKFIKQ